MDTIDIKVKSRSDIITSKSNRKYFTIETYKGEKFICFNSSLHNLFEENADIVNVQVEYPGGEKTPQIKGIAQASAGEAEEHISAAPESKSPPLPDKMTPELWDAKEARTRKSIERQKSAELAILTLNAGKITEANFEKLADKIYAWISK